MKRLLCGLLPLLAVSCVQLPAPHMTVPAAYLYGEGFNRDSLPCDFRWWERFGDSTLNRIEERALEGNYDLAVAASRVEQARRNLAVARAAWLPAVGAELSASGGRTDGVTEQHYAIVPALQWEVSLFGALRAANREAKAEILASEWAFRGAVLSLTAEVATVYFTLLEYERDLTIAERTYELRSESAALVDSMARYGMASGIARDQARSLMYEAAADRAQYRRLVEQTQLNLLLLLGEEPKAFDVRGWGGRLLRDVLPESVPAGLPSDLLTRRPDVMEALFTLESSAARVGMARAARFPTLSLTASGGVASRSLEGLTSGSPGMWSAAAKLVQPLFAFGKLKRQEQAAREAYYQELFRYEQSLLQAFSDVESALSGIAACREQTEQYRESVSKNELAAFRTRALYRSGMSAYLDVIDAERTYYESETRLVSLTVQQYIGYVNLFKALGGGW